MTSNPPNRPKDGTQDAGLQFVSYQRSLEEFAVIFTRWMENASFPEAGAGIDALIGSSLVTIEKAGFFFSPPLDPRFIGASIFDPPPPDPCTIGRVVVQKELLGENGQPVLSELGSISFQLLQAGQPVGAPFTTDSTGRAISPPVPRGVLVVHEVSPPQGFQQAGDTEVTLTGARTLVRVANHVTPGPGPGPIYTG